MKKLINLLLGVLLVGGCSHKNDQQESRAIIFHVDSVAIAKIGDKDLTIFGVSMKGRSTDEIITNLIEKTEEFDYYENERTGIWRVKFCGVGCGLNLEIGEKEDSVFITNITLLTDIQDKKTFEILKAGVSKRYGEPYYEEHEGDTMEIDGVYCGRCGWDGAKLRHVNGETKGFFLFLHSQTPK